MKRPKGWMMEEKGDNGGEVDDNNGERRRMRVRGFVGLLD